MLALPSATARRLEGLEPLLSGAAGVGGPAYAEGPQDLSLGRATGLWQWILPSAFQFMTNSSYLGRWGGAGREETRSPRASQLQPLSQLCGLPLCPVWCSLRP